MSNDKIAWHYTIGQRALGILKDRCVNPATDFVPEGETPIVWFSLRQHWEPTANKGWLAPDGTRRTLTMEETLLRGGGGWRFGLPASQLVPYKDLKRTAKIHADMARGLERTARKAGADPTLWYGSLTAVNVLECIIERLNGRDWQAPEV